MQYSEQHESVRETYPDRRPGRDNGLDMLRALSMLMIVCMHVMGQGGVLIRRSSLPLSYDMCWLLESFCFCAVNCYGLISGYVGIRSKWRPSRYLELYLTVWFYSAGVTGLFAVVEGEKLTRELIIKSLLPVSSKAYWYFSCYTALFFLVPFLNRMVLSLQDRERRALMKTEFLIFCILPLVPKVFQIDILVLLGGYSPIWLIALYVFGACMALSPPKKQHGRMYYLTGYILFAFSSWAVRILAERITMRIYGEIRYNRILLYYNAPTIFLCGVCLLLAFRNIYLKQGRMRKISGFLGASSFSVYLLHTQPVIWDLYLKGAFSDWSYLRASVILLPVLGAGCVIYVLCSAADLLRMGLFHVLHIHALTSGIDRYFAMGAADKEKSENPV